MGRNRCPNCGKRVPEYELSCPRCGYSSPSPVEDPEDDPDELYDDDDESIDDPELLERAEAYVRGLPMVEMTGLAATLKEAPEWSIAEGRPALDENSDAADDPDVQEAAEPAAEGGECPACGRQAHKGWTTCPWCGSPLSAGR